MRHLPHFLLAIALLTTSLMGPVYLARQNPLATSNPLPEQIAELPPTLDSEPVQLAEEAPDESTSEQFTDISGHFAEDAIQKLAALGAIGENEDGKFHPDEEMSRAEIVKVAMLAFGHSVNKYDFEVYPFADVHSTDWFAPYAENAYLEGIIKGGEATYFEPSKKVNRAEALKIILLSGGQKEFDSVTPNFNDVDPYSDWFAAQTAWAKSHEIVNGTTDGNFRPAKNITRGEVCVIVVRLMEFTAKQPN
jgi:hypothetical protein